MDLGTDLPREQSGPLSLVERIIVLLRQLSYAIKNQLLASKAPYFGIIELELVTAIPLI